MAYYLIQIAYTAETWTALVKNPQNRLEAARPVVEGLGGSIVGGWLAFGEYDIVGVLQMPDNTSAAALSIAISAGGGAKAFKTTPLMTWEEGIEALGKTASAGFRPPRSE
ncbi:MAG: GYD domain-containing protein [Anaerolineae bacterium]|nr:GYD domain-containing protein [Anaerolineae bacterium]